MSGSNNGSGAPLSFQCGVCRKGRDRNRGRVSRVVVSGRTRPYQPRCPVRMDHAASEYRCNDCGHVGWSAHVDLRYAKHEPWGGRK